MAMEAIIFNLFLSLCTYLFIFFLPLFSFENDKCSWFLNMLQPKLNYYVTPSQNVSWTVLANSFHIRQHKFYSFTVADWLTRNWLYLYCLLC
jgi:hypothetical protein